MYFLTHIPPNARISSELSEAHLIHDWVTVSVTPDWVMIPITEIQVKQPMKGEERLLPPPFMCL